MEKLLENMYKEIERVKEKFVVSEDIGELDSLAYELVIKNEIVGIFEQEGLLENLDIEISKGLYDKENLLDLIYIEYLDLINCERLLNMTNLDIAINILNSQEEG